MINIRTMQIEDCAEVVKIDQVCFSNAWSLSMFENIFNYPVNRYFVAVDTEQLAEQQIIGFAGIMVSVDTADITNIGVLPEYRGSGIGESLLKKLEDEAKKSNCEQIMLEVREHNNPAISLYRKHGFNQIAIRKNYYSNPIENGLIFQKPIISTRLD